MISILEILTVQHLEIWFYDWVVVYFSWFVGRVSHIAQMQRQFSSAFNHAKYFRINMFSVIILF